MAAERVTEFMSQVDADQLERWVENMTADQVRLLWRWVGQAWAAKMEFGSLGPPSPPVTDHARMMHG